jgi:hypothetical protein
MIINGTNNNYIYSGINTNIIIYENSSNTSNSVISPSTDIQISMVLLKMQLLHTKIIPRIIL